MISQPRRWNLCNRGQNTLLRLATNRPPEFLSEWSEVLRPRSGRASDEASNEGRLVLTKEFSLKVYCHPYSETPFYGHPYITNSSYIFSILTREIWTQVNTDNGHFSVSRVTNSHIRSTSYLSDTDYLRIVSFFHNKCLSQLCANCRHCTLFKSRRISTG